MSTEVKEKTWVPACAGTTGEGAGTTEVRFPKLNTAPARGGHRARRPPAHPRRRWHRQDQHPGPPGCPPGPEQGGPGQDPAAHLHAPRGDRDDAAGTAGRGGIAASSTRGRAAAVVGDVPFGGEPAHPQALQAAGALRVVQRAGPRRRGGPDGHGAPRAGLFENGRGKPSVSRARTPASPSTRTASTRSARWKRR